MADAQRAPIWALGFMTGTSLDGVDAALVETDGEAVRSLGPSAYRPYPDALRSALEAATARALAGDCRDDGGYADAARALADFHAAVGRALIASAPEADPALVGFHGQTLAHRPELGRTLQIGDAVRLSQALSRPVVHQFRLADMAAGGQGAPLAPFYHFALARRAGLTEPAAFLNLGGVANVTWLDPSAADPAATGAILAFDTGPANGPIDDWIKARTGAAYDQDGAASLAGRVDAARLRAALAAFPFADEAPPKSLDRSAFGGFLAAIDGMSVDDGAATLAAAAADCAARGAAHFPRPVGRWIVCGGGRRNAGLMAALRARLAPAPVGPVDDLGVDGDMVEAQAFAYLAVRSAHGLPLTAPGSTGAAQPQCGGQTERAT